MEKEYQELWLEFVGDPNSLCGTDILDGGDFHRIWEASTDETLRSTISTVNSLLNDPKTRPVGLLQLVRFIQQVPPSRWITIHEGLTSSIHLALKSIHLVPAQTFFTLILPNAGIIPELGQLMSSTVVPKILAGFSNSKRDHVTNSWLGILKLCLVKYHGACGNHRPNLEKKLLDLIEKDDKELEGLILEIWPLLSQTGGSGTGGVRHSKDWHSMVIKICGVLSDCILQLYGDWCPLIGNENPFISAEFPAFGGLKLIKEKDALTRITRNKIRLSRFVNILCHYLNDPFPTPKQVPDSGILHIIRSILVVNPVDLLKTFVTPPKEIIYLSLVLPKIHQLGFKLLKALIGCLGDNIFLHSAGIEQMFLHQLKWMSQKADSFSDLKGTLYTTIGVYLDHTSNLVVSHKLIPSLLNQILSDIEIRKSSVELGKFSGKNKTGKKNSQVMVINASRNVVIKRDSNTCSSALKVLSRIVAGEIEPENFKAIYVRVTITVLEILNADTSIPSPYDVPICRVELLNCLIKLLQTPVPSVPISLSFLAQVAVRGNLDSATSAKHTDLITLIEKLIHPIRPSLSLAPISLYSEIYNEDDENDESMEVENDIQENNLVQKTDSFSQTDVQIQEPTSTETNLEKLIEQSIRKVLNRNQNLGSTSDIFNNQTSSTSSVDYVQMPMLNGKRSYDEIDNNDVNLIAQTNRLTNGIEASTFKKSKSFNIPDLETATPISKESSLFISEDLEAMLNDFVDVGPDNL